ncbi:MAG: hypothetical protein KDI36_03445, partial [Pseudomonadales bacterium]|nr:hypothetical protein [Pseudomonadales bacterium]
AAVDPQTGQAEAGSPDIASTDISSIRLASVLEQPVWLLAGQRFDAVSGTLLPPVTEDQARQIVNHRSSFAVKHAEWIETVAPDSEYRGGELPAWRLHLQDADDAVIYVGAHSGAIRAVRTTPWRWFDFLWMLHVMDYEERENFNHWLIQAMAILGLATVLSGLILFGWSQTSQWQRRRHRRATA